MSLLRLNQILPPPTRPAERPTAADWRRTGEALGELPDDYRSFLDLYGSGLVDKFIWIYNPASRREELNLIAVLTRLRTEFALANEQFGGDSLRFFPEDGGLMPAGHTTNGDLISWRTKGPPEQWVITVNPGREEEFFDSNIGLTTWLEVILSGRARCNAFPQDFPSAVHTFDPLS